MTTTSSPKDPQATLRGAVKRVEEQLAIGESPPALTAAWNALVEVLALGPGPKLRECPACGEMGMFDATRCGHCWARLAPVATPSL